MKKIVFLILFLISCKDEKTPPRPTPIVKDTEFCESAGKNLEKYQCIKNAESFTPAGKSFKRFCEEKHQSGVYLNPQCLTNIKPEEKSECKARMDECTYSK